MKNSKYHRRLAVWDILLVLTVVWCSCTEQTNTADKYMLQPVDDCLEYAVDEDTRVPLYNLYTFEDKGVEYLTFSNSDTRTVLIYELQTGKLVKKVSYDSEGPNGIGTVLFGYLVKDFGHIYIPNINQSRIYETDTTGIIRKTIDFSKAEAGLLTVPAYYTNQDNKQLYFIGDSLYIPQALNRSIGTDRWVEESPVAVFVDTLSNKIKKFPMLHPYGEITSKNYNSYISDISYGCLMKDSCFVYSFALDENLYKVNILTGKIETFGAKSRYLSHVHPVKLSSDLTQLMKKTCEMANYGNILYDKYRKVYYRFVALEAEIAPHEDYRKILHAGKADFSIMILDENFNVLGETRFPAYTYVPHICFINEDGLYLSTSHFKREDYSDDLLRFQRIELVKN